MTQLLAQAIAEVQKLPQTEQDAIATLILEELADEERWDGAFIRSQDQLARLAAKVRDDISAGRVRSVMTWFWIGSHAEYDQLIS